LPHGIYGEVWSKIVIMMEFREKIDPKHTAFVVIDIQNDFASPDSRFFRASRGGDLSLIDPMIDKLEETIPVAKKAGVDIIYTQQIYDPSKLNKLQIEQYELDGKLKTCSIDTDGYKFYRIDPPKKDVYVKYNYNIFSNGDLRKRLIIKNIKTLVITGMDIIFCVDTAVRNGFDLGYKIVVVEDMVAGNAKYIDWNKKTLDIIKYGYGMVVTSTELIEAWLGD
jgi:ureidoacrylate peracid hydrolase